jgi:UDP-N-acetylglucosamine--N-acetylmuramyl-(pentapeptide) pyrophosphoryl-undecaprenol N-acetylglucosamine transferase
MKLLAVGGGSGGHVTPVRAVIAALAATDPKLDVVFVCDTRFAPQSRELMSHAPVPVRVVTIAAGKWRRYHGQSWATRLRDVRTNAANLRDIFLIAVGALQSLWLLYRERPDVVFAKGGFVCVPVGWAAHVLRIPLVIHDSDTKPGLTNRWLSRWADAIATGAPLDNYPYRREISHFVGIPIDSAFHPFGEEEQKAAKDALGISDITKPLLVVTGGGLGAKAINDAAMGMVPELARAGVAVYHIVGKAHYDFMYQHAPKAVDYVIVPFVGSGMDKVLGAACYHTCTTAW